MAIYGRSFPAAPIIKAAYAPPGPTTGTVAVVLDEFAPATTGVVQVTGTSSATLDAFTSTASGTGGTAPTFSEPFNDSGALARFLQADFRTQWDNENVGLPGDGNDHNQGYGGSPPGNVTVSGGKLVVECGVQNYGETTMLSLTRWDGSGSLTFKVNGSTDSEAQIVALFTDRPYAFTSFDGENANGPKPETGFGLYAGCPKARIWNSYVQTDWHQNADPVTEDGGSATICSGVVTKGTEQTWVITLSSGRVLVTINGTQALPTFLPPTGLFTSGMWVRIGTHNHASDKYTGADTVTNIFDDLDYPTMSVGRGATVAPSGENSGTQWGWNLVSDVSTPLVHSTTSFAKGTATDAWLVVNTGSLADGDWTTSSRLNYRLNGNSWHAVAPPGFTAHSFHNAQAFSIPLTLSELVDGVNTVEFTGTSIANLSSARYANIQLVAIGGDGTVTVTGTSATTLAAFTSTATGTAFENITGTSATTLAAFTSTATGTHAITGTSATTLDAFTSTGSGTAFENIVGTSATTLAEFMSTAAGTADPPGISGNVAAVLDDFTSSAAGVHTTTGSSATTLDPFTSTATGTAHENITGTSATTLDEFTSSSAGTANPPGVAGSVAVTLDDFTSSATGTHTPGTVTGTSDTTLDAFTSSAAGTHLVPITGTVAATIDAFTATAAGAHTVSGTVVVALDAFTAAATGTHLGLVTGTAAVVLDPFTSQAYEITIPYVPNARRTMSVAADRRRLPVGAETRTVQVPAARRQEAP